MTVKDAYKKFQTPKNLQEHMLRVARVAKLILDSWTTEFPDKKSVIIACNLHDIAKPVAFDLSIGTLKKYGMSSEDGNNLKILQQLIKENFGTDEHRAAVAMCREVSNDELAAKIIDVLEWNYIPELITNNNLPGIIGIYCDMRVGPDGILSLRDRVDNLHKRYGYEKYANSVEIGTQAENVIQKFTKLDLSLITDTQLENQFDTLLSLEI